MLLLALPGCGGGDGETSGKASAGSLTKAQFLEQGNAICGQVFDEIDRRYGKLSNESTDAELNEQAQEIVPPLVTRLVNRLRALGAPRGEEARVEKILVALEKGVETAEEDVNTVRGSQGEFAFEEGYEMLWAYGLERCGLSDG
ncbi:MAG: hypothetical protein M3335_04745 [Actinomycetota bacterium]|nr:hypothetical protein [Actinomycetota bacterium]